MSLSRAVPSSSLLKEHLAAELKQIILKAGLRPGERVIEGKWAKTFGVAQASVREAINLLIAQGFLIKDAGRSARVVNYCEGDVTHIYEVRSAIEGLAAELSCSKRADLAHVEAALNGMVEAASKDDMKGLIQSDLLFHVCLLDAAGNRLVADIGRKLLFPLFAFIEMRVVSTARRTEAWSNDLQYHRNIVSIIREGDPSLANQYVQHCIKQFAVSAYEVWAHGAGTDKPRRSSRKGDLKIAGPGC
jgi:GntR family transcriptional regulator, trigonelline degradation regulator